MLSAFAARDFSDRLQYIPPGRGSLHPTRKAACEARVLIRCTLAHRGAHVRVEEREVVAVVCPELFPADLSSQPQRQAEIWIGPTAHVHRGAGPWHERRCPARTQHFDETLACDEPDCSFGEPVVAIGAATTGAAPYVRARWQRPTSSREATMRARQPGNGTLPRFAFDESALPALRTLHENLFGKIEQVDRPLGVAPGVHARRNAVGHALDRQAAAGHVTAMPGRRGLAPDPLPRPRGTARPPARRGTQRHARRDPNPTTPLRKPSQGRVMPRHFRIINRRVRIPPGVNDLRIPG